MVFFLNIHLGSEYDQIIVFGDLDKIDCNKQIRIFIEKKGLKVIEFKGLDVIDYGGIVEIDE